MTVPAVPAVPGKESKWSILVLVLFGLALGGIAIGMFMTGIADGAAYLYQKRSGVDYALWLVRTFGIMILSAVAIALAIRMFLQTAAPPHP